jgi:hypothetical protein
MAWHLVLHVLGYKLLVTVFTTTDGPEKCPEFAYADKNEIHEKTGNPPKLHQPTPQNRSSCFLFSSLRGTEDGSTSTPG